MIRIKAQARHQEREVKRKIQTAKLGTMRTLVKYGIVLGRKYAPYRIGNLRASIKSGKITADSARFGSTGVVYARIHEFGGRTGRDYKTEIKRKRYLGRAADKLQAMAPSIARRHFKGVGL
jgi:phage gpG-like protein